MGAPLLRDTIDPRAIINPLDEVRQRRTRGGPAASYPTGLVLHFTAEVLKTVRRNYDAKLADKNWWGWLYTIRSGGSKVGVLQSGIGDSLAALVLELLIARGAADIIVVGTAGTLQRGLGIGEVVLTERAIRDEGVSYHYEKPSKYSLPSRGLNRRVEKTLREMKIPYAKGTTWTNDAPFREAVSDVRRFQREGALCVEMEAASLFSVARFRGVNISSLHWISDDVSGPKWDPRFNTAAYDRGRSNVVEAAVRTLLG